MDVKRIREDFPVLENSKGIVYFDNACMSLKPRQVIQAMLEYYERYTACVGRSNHRLGKIATEKYNEARKAIAKFVGAKKPEEIVFTRNTTEGINLVANSLDLKKGDIVLASDREHNSNLIPWQLLKERKGIEHRIVRSREDCTFDMEEFKKSMSRQVKLVTMVWTSNIDGYKLPVWEIIKTAHDFGALVLLDGAQAVPHSKTDVRRMDADFLAFSGHKMLGPTGTGILYGKYELLERLEPFMVGGDTVERTTYETHKFLNPPEKFEAGLQDYAGMIGLGEAARYLERIGMENIEKHEVMLNKLISERISQIPNLQMVGIQNPELRGGIISFNIRGMKYHDISLMLDHNHGILIRSGQHCCHSWFNARGIEGSARASLYLYNTQEEAELFAEAVQKIAKLGK
ncbi:MAG: cysteine desulfurase [Candidatus Aenigmarchaeota archaeon]|nr:cysteine desulfurase [Candidatus Aenigmarchaeota archaeon]